MKIKNPNRFVVISLLVGWFYDFMFVDKAIGISFFIFILIVLFAGNLLAKDEEIIPQTKSQWLILPILFFSAMTFVRAEPFTIFMNVLSTLILLGIYAHTFRNGEWLTFNLIHYLKGAFSLFFDSLYRQLVVFNQQRKDEKAVQVKKLNWGSTLSVLRGIFLAFPIIIIFTKLLMDADPIFEQKVIELLSWINFENIIEYIFRIFGICLIGYLISGIYLHAFMEREQKEFDLPPAIRFLGMTETSIVLGSIIFLFLTFVTVQFQYFFGGNQSRILEGFTYSEYARKGFAELNLVALFSLILFVTLSLISRRNTDGQKKAFSIMGIILMILVGIILISSNYRLQLYEMAFGFTRLRTYTNVYIIWIAILLLATILLEITKNQKYFTISMLVTLFGFVISLNIINIDKFIVTKNIARSGLSASQEKISANGGEFDIYYVSTLSSDALPAIYDAYLENGDPALVATIACFANQKNNFERHQNSYRKIAWQSFHYSLNNAKSIWKSIQDSEDSGLFEIHFEEDSYNPHIIVNNQTIYCWGGNN